jgi:hypothetical protein
MPVQLKPGQLPVPNDWVPLTTDHRLNGLLSNPSCWQSEFGYPNQLSHSGLFDPRGTITVRYDPGDLDR